MVASVLHDLAENSKARRVLLGIHLSFTVNLALLVAGGCLEGQTQHADLVSTGGKMIKAGFVLFAVLFASVMGMQAFLWTKVKVLLSSSVTVSGTKILQNTSTMTNLSPRS